MQRHERTRGRFARPGRHRDDPAIVALAVPALGALAADPLYSLADTAFVGHLGAAELGAVAIGAAAFTASFWLFSFLAYGVTPQVARAVGGDDEAGAARIGVQALLMAGAIGIVVTTVGVVFAGPIVRLLGASGRVEALAESYLRIRVLSATAVLIAQVGHGWLRGHQDTRTPMYIVVIAGLANTVLDYVLIYVVGMGVQGAAWSTVAGQVGAALVFLVVLRPRLQGVPWRIDWDAARSLLVVGADLVVRTGALLAAMTFATAVAARIGVVSLAAWQVTQEMFLLLALMLDSVAIAGQALVGKHLGAGAPERAEEIGRRLMQWGLLVGAALLALLLPLSEPVARIFTSDPEVVAATAGLLVWLALIQPLSALAFTLDGVLIGATDTRFLAKAMALSSLVYAIIAAVTLMLHWGTGGLMAGVTVWLGVRSLTTGARWRSRAWAT